MAMDDLVCRRVRPVLKDTRNHRDWCGFHLQPMRRLVPQRLCRCGEEAGLGAVRRLNDSSAGLPWRALLVPKRRSSGTSWVLRRQHIEDSTASDGRVGSLSDRPENRLQGLLDLQVFPGIGISAGGVAVRIGGAIAKVTAVVGMRLRVLVRPSSRFQLSSITSAMS